MSAYVCESCRLGDHACSYEGCECCGDDESSLELKQEKDEDISGLWIEYDE